MSLRNLNIDIKTRLTAINEKIDEFRKMLEHEKDPEKIIKQFKTVNNTLDVTYNSLITELFNNTPPSKIEGIITECLKNSGEEQKFF